MAHTAGAPDLNIEVFIETVDRAAQCLAQVVATLAGWRRIHNHIDSQWDYLARPLFRLPEHQRQWDSQTVVNIHLVDNRQVEIVLNNRLHDVPGKIGAALNLGHWASAPAFVGRFEIFAATDGKRRNHIQTEC